MSLRQRKEIQTVLRKIGNIPENLEYLIILGAHVRGTQPTKALRERLDRGLAYLRDNPCTKAVLSGGKGQGEDITEAQAMANYLMERGISQDRLLLENRSTNTKENLDYSLALIGNKQCTIGVVTNHYHVFRGVAIGKKCGCTRIYPIPAPYWTHRLLWYIPREILAIIKDKILGNL